MESVSQGTVDDQVELSVENNGLLILYFNKTQKLTADSRFGLESVPRKYYYESDFEFGLDIASPRSGVFYQIMRGRQIIAKVNWGEIIIDGKPIPKRNNNLEWVLCDSPASILSIARNNSYKLNGEVVATVTTGGELFPAIYKMLTESKWIPNAYNPYVRIDYDSVKLEPFLALCILVTHLSESESNV